MAQVQLDTFIASEDVPSVTLGILTGTLSEVHREAGIFTKEDLINIKLYVKRGLALPVKRDVVEAYVGYKKVDIAGLEPADIQQLFIDIRDHCITWDDVEKSSLQQSINLDNAAEQITSVGDDIISVIGEMPLMVRIKALGTFTDQQLADITYTKEDGEVAVELGKILGDMKDDIAIQQGKTSEVKKKVSNFRIELAGGVLSDERRVPGLEAQVKQKKDLMDKNQLSVVIERLEKDIADKNERIEQLKKDYDKYTGLAFTGAAGGIIGLAITGGIFGAKAEAARKEKNKLIDEVRLLEDQVTGKKDLQKAVETLSRDFADIGIRMIDAEMALNNLDFMWQNMLAKIDESQQQFGKIDDGLSLTRFATAFKKVIDPWRGVHDSALALVKTFNEGLAEYKKLYG